MRSETEFWELIARQFGLVRIGQARALGITSGQLKHWVKCGRLQPVCYGIVGATGAPMSPEREMMLGVLLGSSRAVDASIRAALCRITAATLWDMIEPREGPIQVMSQRKISPREGYEFHWTARLPEDEVVLHRRLPVTDPSRTFLDLCGCAPGLAGWAYRRALRKDLFGAENIIARIDTESRQGRDGLTLAREIVETTDATAGLAKSAEEDRYFDFLVEGGYPPPRRNYKIPSSFGYDWEVDLFYPREDKGFEVSPYPTHDGPTAHERDGRKVLDLARRGITIFPITYRMERGEFLAIARDLLGPPRLLRERSESDPQVS